MILYRTLHLSHLSKNRQQARLFVTTISLHLKLHTSAIPVLQPATSPNPTTSALAVTSIAIINKDKHYIGMALLAPRPSWLPTNGTGQANIEPHCWSISLKYWIRFVDTCMATSTWRTLAKTKGERNVDMYDINMHFIKPWTSRTGCSIACLMDNN